LILTTYIVRKEKVSDLKFKTDMWHVA